MDKGPSQYKLQLFSYFRSSCSWRVRIALELKGLSYEIISVQIMKKEQFRPQYMKINPMGQVPALVVDGKRTLVQSLAIIEFLDEVYPEKPLLPKDPFLRAKVREISELIASGIQPLQNLGMLEVYSKNADEQLKWAQHWIVKGLTALEKILEECSGKFCVGNEITMADCCFIPQIANAHRFKVDIQGYPTICRLEGTLSALPEFQRAHASQQPDCPPEMYSKF